MSLILTLISLIVIYVGVTMILKPDGLLNMVKMYVDEVGLQVMAAVGRILLGTALIVYADHSRLPALLTVLGWLSLIAGVVFLFLPQAKFREFILMMLEKLQGFMKPAGAAVTVFGLVLLYAVCC